MGSGIRKKKIKHFLRIISEHTIYIYMYNIYCIYIIQYIYCIIYIQYILYKFVQDAIAVNAYFLQRYLTIVFFNIYMLTTSWVVAHLEFSLTRGSIMKKLHESCCSYIFKLTS